MGLLFMVVYGAIIGWIASKLYGMVYPTKESLGFVGSVVVGISGSFLGGFISFLLGRSRHMLSTAGWPLSILGAVLVCFIWAHKAEIQAWVSGKING